MLRLPPLELLTARTVREATSMLSSADGETRLLAGGTDLLPNMKRRHQHAQRLVSLRRIDDLYGIAVDREGELRIGAMMSLSHVAENETVGTCVPALSRAVRSISSPVLRNMGTIGGNICLDTRCTYYDQNLEWRQSIDYCMKEKGEVCWVAPGSPRCWAISASDSAPVLCAVGARFELVSRDGERVISAPDLYQDDGIAYLTKARDEILTKILIPSQDGWRSSFWKLRRRGSIDFSVLSVAVSVRLAAGGEVQDARIFLGAVRSHPSPAKAAAEHLLGKPLTESTIAEASSRARKSGTPMDNTDFLARWRGTMVERYTAAALREAAGMEPGILPPQHAMG